MVRIWGATLLALAATAGTVWAAAAQNNRTWDGSTSNAWNTGTNWSLDNVPDAGDELATIDVTTNNPVQYDTTGLTIGALRVSEDVSGCELNLGNNTLTVDNTTNDGQFGVGVGSLGGATRYGTLRIGAGVLTIVDGGMGLKGDTAVNQALFIYDGAGTVDIQASGLTLTSNATFTMAANSVLRVDGGLTIGAGCTFNGAAGAIIYLESGGWSNSGTFNANGCTVIFDGAATQALGGTTATTFANLTISNTGASVVNVDTSHTVSTALTIDADGEYDLDALTLTLGGTFTNNGTFTSAGNTSTVVYDGTGNQTVTSVTYYNLTISNTGTAVATLGAGAFTVGNTLTMSADGELTANAAQTLNVGLNWSNSGTFNQSTSLVRMNGTVAQKILGSTATTFYDLTIVNTGTTIVDTDTDLTVSNTFTVEASRQFDLDNNTLTIPGAMTVSGTWVAGANQSTVLFTGSGNQTVPAVTYYNLTISNTGTAVATFASGSVTVANTLTISADGELSALAAQSLTVTNNWTNNGTFNASTSAVTLNPTGTSTIGGGSSTTFYDLTINDQNQAAKVQATTSLTVSNAFLINDAADDFDLNATLTLNGTATNNGDYVGLSGSTTIYNGGAMTLMAGAATTYHHLTLQGTGTKTQNGAITVNGDLTLQGSTSITLSAAANVAGNATVTGTATLNPGGQILTLTTTQSTFTLSGGTLASSSAASEIRSETGEQLRMTWSSGTINVTSLRLTRLDYEQGGLRIAGALTWTAASGVTMTVQTGSGHANPDAFVTVTVAQTITLATWTFSGITAAQVSARDETPSGSGNITFSGYSPSSSPDAATLENEGANASFTFTWGNQFSGTADAADGTRVSIAVNGTWRGEATVTAGAWSMFLSVQTNDILHVYYDADAASPRGTIVIKTPGGDIAGLDMVGGRVTLGYSGGTGAITHANMNGIDTNSGTNRLGGTGDSDIPFTLANSGPTQNNLTFTSDTTGGIFVLTGWTMDSTDRTITDTATGTGTFRIQGTWTGSTSAVTTVKTYDATGGSVTFTGAGTLNLGGPVTSLGTLSASTSTIVYNGSAAQTVVVAPYNNLTIDNSGAAVATFAAGAQDVNGNLLINDADAELTADTTQQINIGTNWTNNGTFNAASSTVVLDSGTTATLGGTATTTFYNLTIDTSATLPTGINIDVGATLTVNASRTLTLASSAGNQSRLRLASTGTANIAGTFVASGTMTRTTGAVSAGAATIPVSSTTGFSAAGGTAYIRSDDFTYTGISGSTLTGVTGVTIAHIENVPIGHRPTVTSISGSGFDWNMTGTVNVTALAFGNANADGFHADLAAVGNFVSVQGIAFFSGGTTHMRLRSSGAGEISAYDVSFDSTGTNNVVMVTSGPTFRARFSTAFDAAGSPGEARDSDFDNGEAGAGFADWVYLDTQSISGTMQGEPQFAWDLGSGAFTSLYVNSRDISGAGTADRVYALTAGGVVKYFYDIPNANGDLVGSAWWWTEGAANMVYAMTTAGYLYKWQDTGSALTIQANYPFRPVIEINTDPALGTPITAGLCQPLADGTNIFVCGNQGGTDRIMKIQISNRQTLWISSATITTGLDAWGNAGTTYIYGSGGGFLRVDHTGEAVASIGAGGITAPPFSFWSNTCVLVGDAGGSIHAGKALDATWEELTGFPFAAGGAVTSRINSEWLQSRVYWGDGGGGVHGMTVSSTPSQLSWSPVTVGGGVAIDSGPVVDSGYIYIGNNGGRIFAIDNSDGSVDATHIVASSSVAVGDIFWDWTSNRYGAVTSDGRVVYVSPQ